MFNDEEFGLDEEYEIPFHERAWHRIELYTQEDGSIEATHSTNDDEDTGYPSKYAAWETTYASLEKAIEREGKTRVGILGIQVLVYLDGELLE